MRSRIVMINEKRNNIPQIEDIRTIMVQNTMLKLMEMHFMNEIREIIRHRKSNMDLNLINHV